MSTYRERQALLSALLQTETNLESLNDRELRAFLARELARRFSKSGQSFEEQNVLIDQLIDSMRGFDILEPLLADPTITEIMVNGPAQIFVERSGRLSKLELCFDSREHLAEVIRRIFGRANHRINEQHPIASLRLHDGSRIHAVLPPAAPDGPAIAIRRFNGIRPELRALAAQGSLSPEALRFLVHAVRHRKNIFISGGTGTGKTTFLNALSTAIPKQERVITIEDTAELELKSLPNVLRLEARPEGPDGQGAVSLQDLIRSSLRLRPDRIIVGEVRSVEAFEMIQAMNTGHPGSMSSGHGNSPEEMLDRLSLMLLMASNLPWEALRRLLAASLDLLIQLERRPDGKRQVAQIARVLPYNGRDIQLEPLFMRQGEELLTCKPSSPKKGTAYADSKCPPHPSQAVEKVLRPSSPPRKTGGSSRSASTGSPRATEEEKSRPWARPPRPRLPARLSQRPGLAQPRSACPPPGPSSLPFSGLGQLENL